MSSPLLLTQALAERTGSPSDIRQGEVVRISPRGIDVQVATGLVEGAGHLTSYNPAVGDTVTMISYANSWVVLGRVLGPGTPTDLATPGTAMGLTVLDGMVLSGTNGDIVTTTGVQVPVPRYSLSYYHPPSHWVMLMLSVNWYGTASGDVATVKMIEAASNFTYQLDNTQVSGGIGSFTSWTCIADQSLGGAQRTWSLALSRPVGSGTVRVYDPSNRRGSWFAIDMGPYPNVIRVT